METEVSYTTTRLDRWSWYSYDWANSVYASVCIGVFAPLLIDSLATQYSYYRAGQDYIPHCKESPTDGSYLYPNTTTGCIRCQIGYGDKVFYNDSTSSTMSLTVVGSLGPSAFALVIVAVSVFLQMVCFISFGSMADYSTLRKQFMLLFAYAGAGVTILFVAIPENNEGTNLPYACTLLIVSNVLFGLSTIFYNAFLPYLVFDDAEIRRTRLDTSIPTIDYLRKCEILQNDISGRGFIFGYISGVIALLISAGVLFGVGSFADDATEVDAQRGYRWVCFFSGLWWFVFTFCILPIHSWPGKAKPDNFSYITMGWVDTYHALIEAKRLPQTFRFLLIYFIFSDGLSTTASVGLLFAKRDMCATTIQQFIVALLVPLVANVGIYIFQLIHVRFNCSGMSSLRQTLLVYLVLPVWGLIGYIPQSPVGFRNIWELYFIGILYGFIVGASQTYSRTVFADLIPPGKESQFFSLYAITDKGSSWIGPIIVALLQSADTPGVMRIAFVYLLISTLVPLVLLGWVDVAAGKLSAGQSADVYKAQIENSRVASPEMMVGSPSSFHSPRGETKKLMVMPKK